MTATALAFADFDEVVAEKEIDFTVQRHWGGEVTEESAQAWHCLFLDHQYYNFGAKIARGVPFFRISTY
jgi:hypothetical protein